MPEDLPEAEAAAGALDATLLDAKLSVPQPRAGTVSRAALVERARASGCRAVGVTAPAGYGKSTLLAEWALAEDRRVAWVSLDRFDDDPAALLSMLASAFARIEPGNTSLVADVGGLGASLLGRAAPRLASAFRSSPEPFVVMLDDLHELRSPACHDVLEVVIAGVPRGSQLVAASRSDQPHLPRLRASGDALELLAGDLALDAHGAEQIFSHAQISITPEVAATVTERTEGWPVGLYLASLIAGDQPSTALKVSGDDRWVADYLYREALSRLSEDDRKFLRWTAVLDQLSAPLCDAVMGIPGSQERLLGLEASSLFLIPLDRRRVWYRYHTLFREFLLGELRRVEPDVIAKLHLRAADWYESQGSSAMALEHLFNTTERDRCVQLVTALILPIYQIGQMSTVEQWLLALGDEAIEAYPPLAVLAGWAAVLTGRVAEAQRWAATIDAASFDLVSPDGTASFDSARAMLRAFMCPAGPDQMLADAGLALAAEPSWSPWRDQALGIAAEAHLLTGDVDQAVSLFAEASAVAARNGNTDGFLICESELALVDMDRGRWAKAADRIDLILATVEEHRMHDYAMSVIGFAGAARLAMHHGDPQGASRHLTQAMRARPTCTIVMPFIAVRLRLQLAKVYWALGDHTAARHLLREIDDVLVHRPALGVLIEDVSALRDMVTTAAQMGASGGSPLTPAELRLLPYLQTHLSIREIADRLFVSRNTVNSEVGSIYRKLGVSSRSEAVQRATTIGLLGG